MPHRDGGAPGVRIHRGDRARRDGHPGGGVAGTLIEGTELADARGLGRFGTEADSDPFTVTSVIREPLPRSYDWRYLFPYVSDRTLLLEPGTYTLFIWADESPLVPFGRWALDDDPEEHGGLLGCSPTVDVAYSEVRISISGAPPIGEAFDAPLPCTLD